MPGNNGVSVGITVVALSLTGFTAHDTTFIYKVCESANVTVCCEWHCTPAVLMTYGRISICTVE